MFAPCIASGELPLDFDHREWYSNHLFFAHRKPQEDMKYPYQNMIIMRWINNVGIDSASSLHEFRGSRARHATEQLVSHLDSAGVALRGGVPACIIITSIAPPCQL